MTGVTSTTGPAGPPLGGAVVLPGTGSDGRFARAAFGPALAAAGVRARWVDPTPGGVVAGYRDALDAASQAGPVLVAGISLGALVGLAWAAQHPGRVVGLALALPPWSGPGLDGGRGDPAAAPAALAATATAAGVERDGLDAVLAGVAATAPPWLAAELDRAWRAQRSHLVASLREAAAVPGPTAAQLRGVTVPVGLAASPDDAVHPEAVARRWAQHLPRCAVHTVGLGEVGRRRAALGDAAVAAWQRAARS